MGSVNTTNIILFFILLLPIIFINTSKSIESFTQKNPGQEGEKGNDSNCGGTRSGGKMRDGRCYYEYTDQNVCDGIKWKKCDASRGDHKGDPDSGRYVVNGNKRIFCRLDESNGSSSDGECVTDFEENIETVPTAAPTAAPTTTRLQPTEAPIKTQCPDTCGIHGDMDSLREQISFVQNSLISV